ncbi:gp53-like domain-containing protein [Escherichia coli]|uniref:gp53-like domain-containing protein n=1 Tax=Escherichia coli TaxID=562 RepID=UPI00199BF079|nr:hypothetical protein [Escherichia coli]HAM4583802.1 hypothetical protein [Escherichia coli]
MLRIGQVEATATQDGKYTDGSVAGGIAATRLRAAAFNAMQEELAHIVESAGLALDINDMTQVLKAIQKLTLSRANPFADIKSDGAAAISTALTNLGLGEAAKRNVGTGANQIPDMGSFTLSVSDTGYQKLPSGFILQWGSIGAPGIAQDVVTHFPIAFPNRCLRVLVSQDYTPGSGDVGYIACAGFSSDPVKFISRASTPGLGASFLALGC